MSIKHRHPIRDSDLRKITKKLESRIGSKVKDLFEGKVETAELDTGEEVLLVDGKPVFVKKDEKFFPLISSADRLSLKRVTVDMGAVKPISDGADIMAPGIVDVGKEIEKKEIVGIEDEENNKIIAIGEALEKSSELKGEEGKVIKNVHYVGDKYWSLHEEF